ncbi:MAG TPA: hypothetical protein VHL54_01345, partial [Actinomycetota bacterium]|nr:hypothetical protein [Actinomycetota bacterium]
MAEGSAESRSARWLRRFRDWLRSLDFTLARRFGLATREDRLFFLLIGLMGVIAGVLGIAVHSLIAIVQELLWRSPGGLIEAAQKAPPWLVVLAPALGGLLVGLITWIARQPVGGGGMSALIEAVALSGGKVPPR